MATTPSLVLARTPEEVQLYVEIHGGTGVEVVSRSPSGGGELWNVASRDDVGGAQHYSFLVQHPNGSGLGEGQSPCLSVKELMDYAERLAATVPANVSALSEQHRRSLARALAIGEQALRLYDANSLQPKLPKESNSLHYRKDLVSATVDVWRQLHGAAQAHAREEANGAGSKPEASTAPSVPVPGAQSTREIEKRYLTWYSLYLSTGNDRELAGVLLERGRDFERAQILDRAKTDFEGALERFTRLQEAAGVGAARVCLGRLAHQSGSLREALGHYQAALAAFDSAGDARGRADALSARGSLWSLGGDQEQCARDLDQALDLFYAMPSSDGVASALLERARLRQSHGKDLVGAELDFREAERLLQRLGDPRAIEARACYEALAANDEPSFGDGGDPLARADALKTQAMSAAEHGDLQTAHQKANEALKLFKKHAAPVGVANVLLDRAKLHHVEGNLELAEADLTAAMTTFEAHGLELGKANVLEARGDLAQRAENFEAARRNYLEALNLYDRLGIPVGIANTHAELARVAAQVGDLPTARKHAHAALTQAHGGVSDYALEAATELLATLEGSQTN